MADDIPETWNPLVSQLNALAVGLGVTLAVLRDRGLLNAADLGLVLDAADGVMPEEAGLEGSQILALVRQTAAGTRIRPRGGD